MKKTISWVLRRGGNLVHKINTNRLITNENNGHQQLEKFLTIESYGTHLTETSKVMFSKEERGIRKFRKDYSEKCDTREKRRKKRNIVSISCNLRKRFFQVLTSKDIMNFCF